MTEGLAYDIVQLVENNIVDTTDRRRLYDELIDVFISFGIDCDDALGVDPIFDQVLKAEVGEE